MFALQIESYRRLVQESLEAREKEEEVGYEGAYDEEKTLVCMNILKTIDQLVSSLESAPASLDKVEAIIAPALEFTVRSNLVGKCRRCWRYVEPVELTTVDAELYDEVFEILDSLSFFQKKISPVMWPLFEATYQSFKGSASDYFSGSFVFIPRSARPLTLSSAQRCSAASTTLSSLAPKRSRQTRSTAACSSTCSTRS